MGAQFLADRNLKRVSGPRLARHGVIEGGNLETPLYFRLLPAKGGLVIEVLPGVLNIPVFSYGAILPEGEGIGYYLAPEIGTVLLEDHPPGSPLHKLRGLIRPIVREDGFPTVRPRDLDAVITIYATLRDLGVPALNNLLD